MPTYSDANFDIRIFIVDQVSLYRTEVLGILPPDGIGAVGIANRGKNGAVILAGGSPANKPLRTQQEVIETITHEIGHVMIEFGHPDDEADPGPAPLVGTDQTVRLMCSGDNRKPGAKLLVKAEWDAAESWLKTFID